MRSATDLRASTSDARQVDGHDSQNTGKATIAQAPQTTQLCARAVRQKLDQGLGQWRACDEPFGRSSNRVRGTRVFKGGLDLPSMTTVASGSLSLAWLHDPCCEYATSRAGSDGSFNAENAAFLLV